MTTLHFAKLNENDTMYLSYNWLRTWILGWWVWTRRVGKRYMRAWRSWPLLEVGAHLTTLGDVMASMGTLVSTSITCAFFLGQIMFNTLKVKTLNALWTIELLYCANPPSTVCGSPLSLQEIITKLLLSRLSLQNSIGKPSSIQQMKATFGLQTTCRRHQNSSSRSI